MPRQAMDHDATATRENEPYSDSDRGLGLDESGTGMKHSGLGVASFIISLGQFAIIAALIVVAVYMEGDLDSSQSNNLALAAVTVVFMNLLAIALGIAGVVQKNRDRTFAILGTVLSIGTVLILVSLAAYGSVSIG